MMHTSDPGTRSRFLRIAGLCGVASPILSLGTVFLCVGISPWFNWHTNALSDIGVSRNAGLFNLALIAGGVLNGVLALGVGRWAGRGKLARAGTMVLLTAAVALALVGVFPEDRILLHWPAAAMYFLLNPCAYALLGLAMVRQGRRLHGALTLSTGLAAFLAIWLVPHDGIAVPEIIAAVIMSSWTFAMGMELLLEP